MLLQELRYFQALVKYKSFTKAAEARFISQSAMSQQLKALENELGAVLVIRNRGKFELTEAGNYLYKESFRLTKLTDRMVETVRQMECGDKPTLTAGCLAGFAGDEMERAVGAFVSTHPGVQFSFASDTHETLYQKLKSGGLDIILSDQRRAFSELYENKVLGERKVVAFLPKAHPLAARQSLTGADLKDLPCIVIANKEEAEQEKEYLSSAFGIESELIPAARGDEASLMALGGRGWILGEEKNNFPLLAGVPFMAGGKQAVNRYCAFWKKGNTKPGIITFARELEWVFKKKRRS